MKRNLLNKVSTFFDSGTKLFIAGWLITILITLKEVLNRSYNNFQIFSYGSLDFWSGNNPYLMWNHLSLPGTPLDKFLYGPLFSILFTPFAIMPSWFGPFCWNTFSYSLYFCSVFTLPERFGFIQKRFIFLYTVLILFSSLLSFQFNPVVAAIYLFSFSLLEKNKGFPAVLLIMISGFIKIYGIFQLAMIMFYPGFKKRAVYAILIFVILFLMPAVKIPLDSLWEYYQSWFGVVAGHLNVFRHHNYSIFRLLELLYGSIDKISGFISLAVFTLMVTAALLRLKEFRCSPKLRAMFLGITMGWVILFSTGSERHTYLIAAAGYAVWFLLVAPSPVNKSLIWINFVLLGILPVDIFFPAVISDFVLDRIFLNVFIFTVTWLIMVYTTFVTGSSSRVRKKLIQPLSTVTGRARLRSFMTANSGTTGNFFRIRST